MGIFISVGKTVECVIIALFLGVLLTMSSKKLLGALQGCNYRSGKLMRWAVCCF